MTIVRFTTLAAVLLFVASFYAHGQPASKVARLGVSYGPNLDGLNESTVAYADKVLRGTLPADLPMEQPTRFEFVLNLKTAKALGLTIPPSVLLRADHVIE